MRKIWFVYALLLFFIILPIYTFAIEEGINLDNSVVEDGLDNIVAPEDGVNGEGLDNLLTPENSGSGELDNIMTPEDSVAGEELDNLMDLEDSVIEDNTIVNVVLPVMLDFTLDPYEYQGRGQIFSDDYVVKNLGDYDVYVIFSDITVSFANETDFKPLDKPFSEEASEFMKAIYLVLDFGRADVEPVVMTASEGKVISIFLSATDADLSECRLRITGNLNAIPMESWKSGDVRISVTYTLEPVIPLEEELEGLEEEQEEKIENEPDSESVSGNEII